MKRSIILFPEFEGFEDVQKIRDKYDPLSECIPPHITLVFPFESDITNEELKEHVSKTLSDFKSFKVVLSKITGDVDSGYLFFNVVKGRKRIIELHDELYTTILNLHLRNEYKYNPHLTIGKIVDNNQYILALSELSDFNKYFESIIEKVYVEMIDEHQNSIIQFSFDLMKQ